MCIVPEAQLEGIPGALKAETCNFEVCHRPTRPSGDHKERLRHFIDERYKTSISNITSFTPQG